jgi:hypothetical protein
MKPRVSVILIREIAEQLTGGGCCGSLTDDDPVVQKKALFRDARQHQRDLGLLHRTIREFFPTEIGPDRVSVVTVDPRNQLYLIPKLWRDVVRYRPGWRSAARTGLQLFSLPAVVVNGEVLSRRGQPLDPDTVCHAIARLLRGGARSVSGRSI